MNQKKRSTHNALMSQYKATLAEKSRLESLIRIEKIKGKHDKFVDMKFDIKNSKIELHNEIPYHYINEINHQNLIKGLDNVSSTSNINA